MHKVSASRYPPAFGRGWGLAMPRPDALALLQDEAIAHPLISAWVAFLPPLACRLASSRALAVHLSSSKEPF